MERFVKISMSVPWYPVLVMRSLIVRTVTGLTVAFAQRAFLGMAQPARISMSVPRTLVHVTKTQLAPTGMGPTPVLANKDLLGME